MWGTCVGVTLGMNLKGDHPCVLGPVGNSLRGGISPGAPEFHHIASTCSHLPAHVIAYSGPTPPLPSAKNPNKGWQAPPGTLKSR